MNDERRRILNMLAGGKINADEADQLLDALSIDKTEKQKSDEPGSEPKSKPKCFSIFVDEAGCGEGKGEKVNIRIPLQLIRAGMKFGSCIPEKAREKINSVLKDKGIDVNINDLKAEQLEEFFTAMKDCCIDIDSSEGKVRMCCE